MFTAIQVPIELKNDVQEDKCDFVSLAKLKNWKDEIYIGYRSQYLGCAGCKCDSICTHLNYANQYCCRIVENL